MKLKSEFLDTSIDKYALDDELIRNGEALKYWYKRITVLTEERDSIKGQIKERESFLFLSITESPQKYGLNKSSAGTIDAKIALDLEIKNLGSDLLAVNKDLSEAYNYKDMFKERSEYLGRLITLFLNNYYAGKREDSNRSKAATYSERSSIEESKEDINRALQKRKNKSRK